MRGARRGGFSIIPWSRLSNGSGEKGQDMMPGVNISYYTGGLYAVVQAERFDELKLDSGSFEQAP